MQFARWSEFYPWSEFCPPGQLSPRTIVVGANFVFPGQNPGGHGDGPGSFRSPGQQLTTLDTLLGRKFSREMSWDKLVLILTMIQILLVRTRKYAYVVVCFSTYVFSTSREFLKTCTVPGDTGPVRTNFSIYIFLIF